MSDNALNYFASAGTAAEMALHTPDPPVPAAGPDYGVRWFQTDTGLTFEWDGAVWVQVSGTGIGTVTNTGTLASGAIVKGNGGADVSTTTTGTGILTALGNNVGSAGAPVVFNGALGTPSSGTLTSCTGLPVGSVTGLGTGIATALGVNVGTTGAPVVKDGALGTPSSGTLTSCTGLPTTGVTGVLPGGQGGGLVLLESHTASASASLDFTTRNASGQSGATFQSDFDTYYLVVTGIIPATSTAKVGIRVSTNGGSSYVSTASYSWVSFISTKSASGANGADGATAMEFVNEVLTSAVNYGLDGYCTLHHPASTTLWMTAVGAFVSVITGVLPSTWAFAGMYTVAGTAVNAFQVLASTGNLTSGVVRLYGVAK